MKFFSSIPKIGSIFTTNFWKRCVDGSWRVNYEVPRLSKLHEDGRRCSQDFQQKRTQLFFGIVK